MDHRSVWCYWTLDRTQGETSREEPAGDGLASDPNATTWGTFQTPCATGADSWGIQVEIPVPNPRRE